MDENCEASSSHGAHTPVWQRFFACFWMHRMGSAPVSCKMMDESSCVPSNSVCYMPGQPKSGWNTHSRWGRLHLPGEVREGNSSRPACASARVPRPAEAFCVVTIDPVPVLQTVRVFLDPARALSRFFLVTCAPLYRRDRAGNGAVFLFREDVRMRNTSRYIAL